MHILPRDPFPSLPFRFTDQNFVRSSLLPMRFTCPAHLTFPDFIILLTQSFGKDTNHELPHYVIFQITLLFPLR
jgi:hypothetical protein